MKKRSLTSVFGRLLWREVFKNWAQSLAIVAIGAIAVTLFVGLSANSTALSKRVDNMVSLSSPADIYVTTDPRVISKDDDTESIQKQLDGNDYLESRFYTFCNVSGRDATLAISPVFPTLSKAYDVRYATAFSSTDYFYIDENTASELKNTSGEDPLGKEAPLSFDLSSITVDEDTLKLVDLLLNPGEKNPFREGKLLFSANVTGIMKHPENTTKASPIPMLSMMSNYRFQQSIVASLKKTFTPTGASLIYRMAFYEKMGWGDGNMDGAYTNFPRGNQYLVKLQDAGTAEAKATKIRAYYNAKENNNLYLLQTLDDTSFMSGLRIEADQAQKLTMVFPVVFFVVAVLVILTTLRQNILKRRTDIGTFKGLGLTKKEIHAHFLTQTAALTLIASLIGCIIGPLIIPGIMSRKYSILYTLPKTTYVFPWVVGISAVAIFILVSLLATYLITYKEIALKPVESLRPKAMKVRRASLRRSQKAQSAAALSVKMAGRNIVRDPLKSIMVVLGVMGCTALLVCGFGIDDTLDYDIKTDPFVNSNFSAMIHYASPVAESKIESDLHLVKDEAGTPIVSTYQPYDRFSLDIFAGEDKYTSYLLIEGKPMSFDGAVCPEHMVGQFPKDQVAMSIKCASRLGVKEGDTVYFYVNNKKAEAKIALLYPAFYGNGIVMYGDSPVLSEPYTAFTNAWVNSIDGIDQTYLKQRLLASIPNLPVVDTATEWMDRIVAIVSSVKTMTAAIKVFALLLAIVVIYNLGLLNFRERLREIATLKVLGFHTLEIGGSLLFEAITMAAIGVLGGLAIGQPFMQLVLVINEIEIIHYLYMIYPLTFLFSALFSLLVAFLVNLILTAKVKGVKAVEALKSVE